MGSRRGGLTGVLIAVVAASVTGCGSTAPAPPASSASPTVAPTPTGTPQEQALAWTDAVCTALVPVVAGLTAAPPLDLQTPEVTRQAYLTYLADGLATTDRARDALVVAGPAPVINGDALAEQVRGEVADLRAHLVDARVQVEKADPGSAVAVGRALVSGSSLVGALLNGAQVAGTINRDPTLHDAYDRSASCTQLQRSGAAPTPGPPTAPAAPVAPATPTG